MLIWITSVVVLIVLISAVFSYKPKDKSSTTTQSFPYDQLPVLGNKDAKVKIVEFGDYQCPSCKRFVDTVKPEIQKDFLDKGTAAFYFMNFAFIGEESTRAALAAQSVYHQNNGAFWTYYEALYREQNEKENGGKLTTDYLVNLAKQEKLPIDYDKLKQDIEKAAYQKELDEHTAKTNELKIQYSPTIYVNGLQYTGNYLDYNSLKTMINKAAEGE
ncbi:protein-disulfide isomerase [Paenibacillus shirakamiensis]|uniref:Protein-disulfide isomerase n=1 Tax=Paenibacillus shirakamiensis TaxID=1265935 RepID=A0ABS4JBH1_9BACL|nr:DsbA family protein [Paenibacillus shirakamiensis]MBP1999062.1 protein-disulfide isomerase [Paenibacillus shirakamiensis]